MAEIVQRNRNDGSVHRHKKAKYEKAKEAVGSYLYKRHYSESEIQKKNITCDELIISQLVENETSRPNSILYSNSTFRNTFNNDSNPISVEPYFNKFVSFVNNLPESFRVDLSKLFSPLFCHIYLDLIQGNQQQSASLLLKFYQEQKFVETDICSQIIREFNTQELKTKPIIKTFRSSKRKIKLSSDSISILRKYLSKNGHILIIQALQNWFDFDLTTVFSQESDEENEFLSCNGDNFNPEFDKDVLELKDAISSVNNQSPPMLLVNIFNSQENSTCGIINTEQEKVVAGFNTSEIYIWSIGKSLLDSSEFSPNTSHISLACDNLTKDAKNIFDEGPLTSTGAVILRGHGDSIQDVKLIPESDILLSVSQDCSMRAWKLSNYSCAAIYRGHNYAIWCLDVSTYGLYIATGSYDKSVRLWSLDRIYPTRIFAGHTKDVNCVNFHPNASYFATGSADKTVRMWSVTEPKTVRLLVGHSAGIYSVAFSPDGHYLASAGDDKTIKIWDLVAAKQLSELTGPQGTITDLSWSQTGDRLSALSLDGTVRVWNTDRALGKCFGDSNGRDGVAVYNAVGASVLAVKYDKKWISCLTATAVCM